MWSNDYKERMTLASPSAAPKFPQRSQARRIALVAALGTTTLLCGCCCCGTNKASEPSHPSQPSQEAPIQKSSKTIELFDGKSLTGWVSTDFAGHGEVKVDKGTIVLGSGYMTGVTWTNASVLPTMNYEISLDAMRVDGSDFFCGLTFPVGKNPCSFIVGGWGGGVVGLSSIDGEDAANNATTSYRSFVQGRWYALRVRVTPNKIQAWIDQENVVDQDVTDRKISIRIEMEPCVPLGIATYSTTGALRNIKIQPL